MPIDLRNKPIIITGASSGIGLATALECSKAGMPVVLTARRRERLDDAAKRIRGQGGKAVVLTDDVADPRSGERAVEACMNEFGSVYGVFANAGYGVEVAVHEMTDADVRRMFEVNFFGTIHSVRPALPHMLGSGSGHVLICSSCLAKFAIPYFGVYSATKAAQNHIGRAMRLELEPMGIHVSTVHPVGTKTEFFETAQKLSGTAPMIQHSPEMFMQPPERVARAVVKCLTKPKPEVWTSLFVRLGMAISTAFPRLADMGVRGMVKQRMNQQAAAPEVGAVNRASGGISPG